MKAVVKNERHMVAIMCEKAPSSLYPDATIRYVFKISTR
jgi:hypothetical protein